MTREEAIQVLKEYRTIVMNCLEAKTPAFDMAIEALSAEPSDLISRADAIEAVHKYFVDKINNEPHEIDEDGDDVFTDMKSVNALFHHNKMVSKAIKALPSADAVSREEYEELYNKAKEVNGMANDILADFPSYKEIVSSADRPSGEWLEIPNSDFWECSVCGKPNYPTDYCPDCGARMKGGAE